MLGKSSSIPGATELVLLIKLLKLKLARLSNVGLSTRVHEVWKVWKLLRASCRSEAEPMGAPERKLAPPVTLWRSIE